jgi:hypothetical protein
MNPKAGTFESERQRLEPSLTRRNIPLLRYEAPYPIYANTSAVTATTKTRLTNALL